MICWERDVLPIVNEAKIIFSDLTVRTGPFKGMKYPDFLATGSSIFPKLLGSYEKELHPLIDQLIKKDYTEIIDIGCAEGYYAVGLAMKLPRARVYAYDTDVTAQNACRLMAKINGVSDRVNIEATCTPEILKKINPAIKTLIISDCEGYEKHLFTEGNIASLAQSDVLIEAHDFIDKSISTYLKTLFSKTHNLTYIDSLSDHLKVIRYDYEELKGMDYVHKINLLGEGRPGTMEWFFFTPK